MILALRMFDWRIGGAMVGRTGGRGLCSSSVFLRLDSVGYAILGFGAVARLWASSSSALLGGFAGLGAGWLIERPKGWAEPRRDAGLFVPRSLR